MSIKTVTVIYKKSALEELGKKRAGAGFRKLVSQKHPSVRRMQDVDKLHKLTLKAVKDTLKGLGINCRFAYRGELPKLKKAINSSQLIVSVGGDGTVLEAGHYIENTPVLGVNSSPGFSVGSLCGTTGAGFERVMKQICNQGIRPMPLTRIQAEINGKPMSANALNEVLIANENPAGTSRYIIKIGRHSEEHKSSGIYICTAAGSTAAIWAAGGKVMPIKSVRLQYLTRELYREKPAYRFTRGFIGAEEKIVLMPKMSKASVYIDGPGIQKRITFGDEITISRSDKPLLIYAYNEKRRQKLFKST